MRGYLLDTNVVSELRKGDRANRNVTAWYQARDKRELYLIVVTNGGCPECGLGASVPAITSILFQYKRANGPQNN